MRVTQGRTFVVDQDRDGGRLDSVLAVFVGGTPSRSQLARQIGEGAVALNDAPCLNAARKVRRGDRILWREPEVVARPDLLAEPIPLSVLFEDEHLIVIDKPAGLVVHPAAGHQSGTLVNALLAHCQDLRGIGGEIRPGIVHRLDRDTSGVMVVAKHEAALNGLAADFKRHTIERVYEALTVGEPSESSGRIATLHGRDPNDRKKFSVRVLHGRSAVTNWSVIERLGGAARIEARLETGRTHQVRLHLAALGCSLFGDAVYGKTPRNVAFKEIGRTLARQALHARVLGFKHPATGQDLRFEAPPPADFSAALAAIRLALAAKDAP
ncbi:MAG: RluA family pseudouridine synthase [Deltaproteobacteria bacterium]|nr:RluA family pseudouridine synthase [Deltaproteobacteria bacterium]